MNIYCCQTDSKWEDKLSNFEDLTHLLLKTELIRGSLIVLPEIFATGFSMDFSAGAESPNDSPTIRFLIELAQDKGCAILAGLVTDRDDTLANEAILIDSNGKLVSNYAKIHPFTSSGEGKVGTTGSWVRTLPLNDSTMAPFVSKDLRFPELFRLATPEAELLIVLTNWPSSHVKHWVSLLKAHAIESQAYVIGANRADSDPHASLPGHSLIIDPAGNVLAESGVPVGIISAQLGLDTISEWRSEFPINQNHRNSVELGTPQVSVA